MATIVTPSGLILKEIEGGHRIRQVGDIYLDVLVMPWGVADLVTVPAASPALVERVWCYRGPRATLMAVAEALRWPDDDPALHVPDFWYAERHTGRTQPAYSNP